MATTDFAYFGINLGGIILIFSSLEKETEPFISGGILAAISGAIFWVLIHRMKRLRMGNAITMNLTIIIILVIFMPIFFPMLATTKPSVSQMLLMVFLGWMGFTVIVLVSRSIQIMKTNNFMLVCTIFLVGKGIFDGYKEGDLDFGIIVGSLLSILSVCLVVRDVRAKYYVEDKSLMVPVIQNN